ncbi:MAG: FAD-dependent monooxygenase [Phycisphaerales bacterium]|nr:FAD-dependent monooxygenase [Phycisphaerales bacterium]
MLRIVIIGAGPAGCIAGIILGRAGLEVMLVEQHRFPRDKVCGECLSDVGITVLEELGLQAELLSSCAPVMLRRALLFALDGRRSQIPLPRPMWGLSRPALDTWLLSQAARVCRVLQPARCERYSATLRQCLVRELTSNRLLKLEFDLLLIADGKAAISQASPPPSGDFGVKAHWQGIAAPDDAIELFAVNGHYGGIAPVEGGRYNLSFSLPAPRLRGSRGNVDQVFSRIIGENDELRRQLRNATRLGPWLCCPLPRYRLRRSWPAGVIPIGNAAAAIEPVAGEGMGLAMRSAQIAAGAILAATARQRPVEVEMIYRQYRRLWLRRSLASRLAAQIISQPSLAGPAIEILSECPALAWGAARLVGK